MESVSIAKKFLELIDPEVKIAGMPDMEICKSSSFYHWNYSIETRSSRGERKDLHVQRNPREYRCYETRDLKKRRKKRGENWMTRIPAWNSRRCNFQPVEKNNRRFGLARDGINQRMILCRNTVEKRRFVNLKFEYKSSRM